MTSWTSPATFADTDPLTAAELNEQLRDNTLNVDERLALHGILSSTRLNQVKSALCGVRLTGSAVQSISTGTDTTVTWNTETYDTDGFHDTGSNTDRITIPSGLDGYYRITFMTRWGGIIVPEFMWVEDDTGAILGRRIASDGEEGRALTFWALLAAGDWIRARVRHDSGVSEDLQKNSAPCSFTAWRMFAA